MAETNLIPIPRDLHPDLKKWWEESGNLSPAEAYERLPQADDALRSQVLAWLDEIQVALPSWTEEGGSLSVAEENLVLALLWLCAEWQIQGGATRIFSLLENPGSWTESLLGDVILEQLAHICAHLARQYPDELAAVIRNRHLAPWYRAEAGGGVALLAMNHGEFREMAAQWMRSYLQDSLEEAANLTPDDAEVLGQMVAHALDLKLVSLMPLIGELFTAELVDQSACGNWEEVQRTMSGPENFWARREIIGMQAGLLRKQEAASSRPADLEASTTVSRMTRAFNPYQRERQGKKVGRNDPCVCGSGKKYKKCCGR